MTAQEKEIFKQVADTLELAKEHLEWIGYGDNWERECADSKELPLKIETALEQVKTLSL